MKTINSQKLQKNCIVDIIIVTFYTGQVLFECIDSILSLKELNEIIIVNNGNPGDVNSNIKNKANSNKKIKLLEGHGNIGFSKACNLGAENSSADYLLFLNPDCLVIESDTLKKFIEALNIDNGNYYKVATCKILNKDGSIQKTCRKNIMTPLVALSESLYLYKICKRLKPMNLPVSEIDDLPTISPVEALSGAVVFTTKKYYEEIGGFSEEYFLHVDDMDLSMRIRLKGDKIAFVKNISIIHLLSTSKTSKRFLEYQKAKGFITYIQKFFPIYKNFFCGTILKFLIWVRYTIKILL